MEVGSAKGKHSTRPRWRRAVATVALVGVLATGVYAGLSVVSAHVLTSPRPKSHRLSPQVISPDPVRWSVATEDGLTLRGWFFGSDPQRPLIILVHGLWENWEHVAGPAGVLRKAGYNVLLFDLRGHGDSDPCRLSMGHRERLDLRAALAWAKGAGFSPDRIGWLGYSMGASTILMEGAVNPDFRAAVLDGPFGDLPFILDRQLTRHSGLPGVFNPGILAAAGLVFGAPVGDLVPVHSAAEWSNRPLLVIHGTADHLIPVDQAHAIVQAAGPQCRLLMLPGVGHTEAFTTDREAYGSQIVAFFESALSRAP